MAQKQNLLILFIAGFLSSLSGLQGQNDDPVLFTVEDEPVRVSEFKYIYAKTNGAEADYSLASLEEYLDLYIKFKLKVQRARDLQLDTIQQLQQELEGYRRQLADSYLISKEVTERLVRAAYERSREDIDLHHIVVELAPNAAPEDTARAYQQAMALKERLENGADFAELARQVSADESAQDNGGHIGYVNVLFPKGFHNMEKVAYNLPLNTISNPVRTPAGYHLLKVTDRRPARGQVEAAHILIRNSTPRARAIIDDIYQQLEAGADFAALAREKSQDSQTASQGGYIGFLGINQYEKVFEDAAFSLEEDNTYTQPFQSSVGWHIVQRISKQGLEPFEQARPRLETQIKRDDRHQAAQEAMIEQIQHEADFTEYPLVLDRFQTTQNDTLFTFRWKAPAQPSSEVLFTLGKQRYTVADFTTFLSRNTRKRMQLGRGTPIAQGIDQLYADYVRESTLRFEEQRLEDKYPEFRALMREYREGILLFEVTKMKVWDKAAQDTSGLKAFFDEIKGKYRWNERAVVSKYTISMDDRGQLNQLREYAAGHPPEEVRERFGDILAGFESLTIEKERSPEASAIQEWAANALTVNQLDRPREQYSFMKVEEILPPSDKELDEARGYVIADYQDMLEQQWVDSLRKAYKVKVNRKVLKSMVDKGQ